MSPVRTRFAPSPTGYLHIGSARTALFSWLYARKHQGVFILRIEDTDQERSTKASIDAILEAMDWLNLDYDEGPFYQTDRFERYQAVIEEMLAAGTAYRCYCSKERTDQLRDEQLKNKLKPRYDGHCRNLEKPEAGPFVVRFKNPTDGVVEFHDLIRGDLKFENKELDDLVIARSDGVPTYNFSVVVDDLDMGITQVIRGDDHINNTPRQVNILRALGATPPEYAHVPMILGSDGKRLSKRHGAVSVMQFRDEGYIPDALLNYLVRLGWSHGDQEIFSRDELIEYFNLESVNHAPAAMNPEKLLWLNQHYIKSLPVEEIANELSWHMQFHQINITDGPDLTQVVIAQRERAKTLEEMALRSRFLFEDISISEDMRSYFTDAIKPALELFLKKSEALTEWNKDSIHGILTAVVSEAGLKLGKLAQPIRVAVTGGTMSPPLDVTLELLGKEKSLKRIQHALALIA